MKIYEFDPVIYPYKVWIVIGKNPHKLKYCFVGSDGNELNDIYEETDSFKAFNVTVIGGSHSNHGVVMFFRNKHQLKNYSLVAHESSHVAKR